jgi:hypothetical protein
MEMLRVDHVAQERHAVVGDGVVELLSVISSLGVVESGNDLNEVTKCSISSAWEDE